MALAGPLFGGNEYHLMPAEAFARDPASWLRTATEVEAQLIGGPSSAFAAAARAVARHPEGVELSNVLSTLFQLEMVDPDVLDRLVEVCGPLGSAARDVLGDLRPVRGRSHRDRSGRGDPHRHRRSRGAGFRRSCRARAGFPSVEAGGVVRHRRARPSSCSSGARPSHFPSVTSVPSSSAAATGSWTATRRAGTARARTKPAGCAPVISVTSPTVSCSSPAGRRS